MSWQTTIRRADKNELKAVFNKYASVEQDGERFMTLRDYVCCYLRIIDIDNPNIETLRRLGSMADTTQDELISFVEFRSFESLLCAPDAINQVAFKMFDLENVGRVSFDNFKKVWSATSLCQTIPFDFDCTFMKQYFGSDKSHHLDYYEFCQLLQNLSTEHARQSFRLRDKSNTGRIPALDFAELMTEIRGFRMSEHVQDHLLSVAGGSAGRRVSYPYFKAFNQMLSNLDIFKDIVQTVCDANHGRATQVQLLRQSQLYNQITPLQVSLLFELCSMDQVTGTIGMEEFRKLLPWPHPVVVSQDSSTSNDSTSSSATNSPVRQGFLMTLAEQAYRFVLGGLAGGTGATAVYPIDLVKTRMQNQRGSLAGEIMYKHSVDCFFKVIRHEGLRGLYRGLLPQLVGVSPEKAIKLTVNDFMRDKLKSIDGTLPVYRECIAGGCGGMCQVMFTNPLEIVKIRLQVAGEMAETKAMSAFAVTRELGFRGLYKGASACLLRDIPFSAIYFSTYAHMKLATADSNGYNGPASLFASAMIAGVPAAYLCTPADVIKTRLQVKARPGQDRYKGIIDCTRKIYEKEGLTAFFKGGPARVFRSAPQFGVTLLTYELLQRIFYVDFGKGPPAQPLSSLPPTLPILTSSYAFPDHIGGYRLAHSTFSSVESRYGLVFPKSGPKPPVSPVSSE